MKYYIIAGEASGDLHGSNLIKQIHQLDTNANIKAWGGDLMETAGCRLVKHYKDLAFMGFYEVAMNLRTILGNISFCKKDIEAFQPDALILIDYPGFNLRIAKWAKAKGIKVFYYISPQIWAWNSRRVHSIKKVVDKMFVILPFEKDFYKKYDYEADFVGHPLLDVVLNKTPNPDFRSKHGLSDKAIIALLPGSRKQEITKMLDVMLSMLPHYPDYQFVIAGAPSMPLSFYENIIQDTSVKIIQNQTYELLQHSQAALVTSGTATLETALFKVPEVVCYKGNPISYWIAKRLVNVKYISLVNLILDKALVTELIQADFNESRLKEELGKLLSGDSLASIKEGYEHLHDSLGNAGASRRTAELIYKNIT